MPVHGDFTVEYNPKQHALCGDLTVTPEYTGSPVPYDDGDTQANYNDNTKVFDYDSEDMGLIGVTDKTREVYVRFDNYDPADYPALTYPDVEVP